MHFRYVASIKNYTTSTIQITTVFPCKTLAIGNSSCRRRPLVFHAHDMKYNVVGYYNVSSRSVNAVFCLERTNCHTHNAVCTATSPCTHLLLSSWTTAILQMSSITSLRSLDALAAAAAAARWHGLLLPASPRPLPLTAMSRENSDAPI